MASGNRHRKFIEVWPYDLSDMQADRHTYRQTDTLDHHNTLSPEYVWRNFRSSPLMTQRKSSAIDKTRYCARCVASDENRRGNIIRKIAI